DAKFWIPTLDEWMKGAYFDPNKGGPGSAGWWMYPGQFDDILPNGLPGEGLTNSGMVDFFSDTSSIFDVGQYPGGASAYGLLDTSGGMSEWTEEPGFGSHRISKGSSFYHSDFSYWLFDPIFDLTGTPSELTTFDGLRIASAVPAPGALGLLGIAGMLSLSRRRRRKRCIDKLAYYSH
ncbi:MAG: PEP-CTERM sorting domain-containing protein, partial [Planctomycetes bacterium]|nr:PEP-CTERM sorting domain-containing protein [Planctomycetota bacterium]